MTQVSSSRMEGVWFGGEVGEALFIHPGLSERISC